MRRTCITRTILDKFNYPSVQTIWIEDEDGNGWTGKSVTWIDGNNREEEEHSIVLRQGQPLGKIFFAVDECGVGAWASNSFEGTTITERDLQWAAVWAVEAFKSKPKFYP